MFITVFRINIYFRPYNNLKGFFTGFTYQINLSYVTKFMINNLIVFGFIITIVGIVLAIVGIIKDDLKEKAIRALIAGICFLFLGSVLIVLFDMYISALLG